MITETNRTDIWTTEEKKAREVAFLSVLAEIESSDEFVDLFIEEAIAEAASFAGLYPRRYRMVSGRRGSLYRERGGE